MPAIIRFLGYNPLPPSNGWADRLVQARTAMGLTQKETAVRIGVDQCTLARWERGEREPTGAFATRASRFAAAVEMKQAPAARTGIRCDFFNLMLLAPGTRLGHYEVLSLLGAGGMGEVYQPEYCIIAMKPKSI